MPSNASAVDRVRSGRSSLMITIDAPPSTSLSYNGGVTTRTTVAIASQKVAPQFARKCRRTLHCRAIRPVQVARG